MGSNKGRIKGVEGEMGPPHHYYGRKHNPASLVVTFFVCLFIFIIIIIISSLSIERKKTSQKLKVNFLRPMNCTKICVKVCGSRIQ